MKSLKEEMTETCYLSSNSNNYSDIFEQFFNHSFIAMEEKHETTSSVPNDHISQDDSSYYSEDNTSIDQNNNSHPIGTLDKSVGEPMESESFTYKGSASNINTEATSDKLVLKDSVVLKKRFFIILFSIVILIFVAQFIIAIVFVIFTKKDNSSSFGKDKLPVYTRVTSSMDWIMKEMERTDKHCL